VQEVQFNWPQVFVWLTAAQWLFNLGIAVWVYFRNADNKNTLEVNQVGDDLAKFIRESTHANHEQNERIGALETDVKHMPTKEDVSKLREQAASTKAQVESMSEQLRRVEHQTTLIHQHLLANH
jgi:seryl-tRNA synthetase